MVSWLQQIDNDHIAHDPALDGVDNGSTQLEARLKPIFDPRSPGKVVGQLLPTAARSWNAMARAAFKEGVLLLPTSAADSFRKLAIQKSIFADRYRTTDVDHTGKGRTCGGVHYFIRKGKATAACPGTSNHGLGRAVDVNLAAGVLAWLEKNAKRFGWQWELSEEDWHIHYMLGDKVSQDTVNAENALGITKKNQENEMVYLLTPDRGVVLLAYGKLVYVAKVIDPEINQWDLREDTATWSGLQKAYGPVIAG